MGVCCSLILTRDLQPVQNEHQLVSYDGWNRLHKKLNWICGKGGMEGIMQSINLFNSLSSIKQALWMYFIILAVILLK